MSANPRLARLDSLVAIFGGGTPSKANPSYFEGDIPWVTPKDMRNGLIVDTEDHISQAGLENSSSRLVPQYSILVVVRSGVLKHTLPVALNAIPVAINQDMKALICNSDVHPPYLAYALKCRSKNLLQRVRGTTADNIPLDELKALPIPIRPLHEQKRIAAILDKAGVIRRKRQQAVQLADEFLRSLFLDMFGDPERNPNRWGLLSLDKVCVIQSGVTKGRRLNGMLVRQVPYMRVANVLDKRIDTSDTKRIDATEEEIRRFRLLAGDILLTEGGDPDKLGRGAVWHGEIPDCIHQNHIFRLRPNRKLIAPEYLAALISSPYGKRYFLRSAKQTTGIATINKTQLSAFPVLLPPIDLQGSYDRAVDQYKVLTAREEHAMAFADLARQALSSHAFLGKL